MTRLIVITQEVDPEHPILAATVAKLRALAGRVDELWVLAAGAVPSALPDATNVRPFRARTKAGRGLRFERALVDALRGAPRRTAVLAHMCPIYAVLAAPLARPRHVPVLLWFTHWRGSALLRLATAVSNRVLSVDRRSFPLETPKLEAIGHGIDADAFPCRDRDGAEGRLAALALGRYSPVKGYAEVLRAVRIARDNGSRVTLAVHGPALTDEERAHRRELERLRAELGLADAVELGEAVPRVQVPELLGRADALVSNTVAGSADKAVLEAALACVPVLSSTPMFADVLPDELRYTTADELAERLHALAALGPRERTALGRRLRPAVAERHGVESWAGGVVRAAGLA